MRKVLNESMSEIFGIRKKFSKLQMFAFYGGLVVIAVLSYVLPGVIA